MHGLDCLDRRMSAMLETSTNTDNYNSLINKLIIDNKLLLLVPNEILYTIDAHVTFGLFCLEEQMGQKILYYFTCAWIKMSAQILGVDRKQLVWVVTHPQKK